MFDGLLSSAGLTWMRPASPVICEPLPVIAPVYSEVPSVNNGSWALPPASEETVAVTEAELTVAVLVPLSTTCSVEPDGLENCRLELLPSAAFNCATTDAIPPEKLTPITGLLGLPPVFDNGSAVGSLTSTTVTLCWVPVAVSV